MRELGFRAWSIKKRKWLDIDTLYCANGKICGVVCGGVVYDVEDVALEQDTGLEDKNGKEIYDGDITQTQYMNAKGWVVWSNGAWDIRLLKDTLVELFLAEEVGVGCEVIGNIHENPELLGGEE